MECAKGIPFATRLARLTEYLKSFPNSHAILSNWYGGLCLEDGWVRMYSRCGVGGGCNATCYMSCSLNSFKEGYIGHYMGEYYGVY